MRILFALLALSLILLSGCTQPQQPAGDLNQTQNVTLNETPKAPAIPVCGDGFCASPEDKANCPQDCNMTVPKIHFPTMPKD